MPDYIVRYLAPMQCMEEVRGEAVRRLKVVHVLRNGEPKCPKCGQGLETAGGSVVPRGSYDNGPLWWECEDCGEEWGHA